MIGCFLVFELCLAISAEGGLAELFDGTLKDFGKVPRGSVQVHRFALTNTTNSVLRIQNLRATCSCVKARALSNVARPSEKIEIEVIFDTKSFVGPRSYTVHVTFEEPRHESVALRLACFSRTDVTFEPGRVDFGTLSKNGTAKRSINVEYRGKLDWRIEQVVSSDSFMADFEELEPQAGKMRYRIDVSPKSGISPGFAHEFVQIKTNDAYDPVLRLPVTATIQGPMVVSPTSLNLGLVKVGQTVHKKVFLRSEKPFRIESIEGESNSLHIEHSQDSRKIHLLEVKFEARQPGSVEHKIAIKTNLEDENPISVQIIGIVTP